MFWSNTYVLICFVYISSLNSHVISWSSAGNVQYQSGSWMLPSLFSLSSNDCSGLFIPMCLHSTHNTPCHLGPTNPKYGGFITLIIICGLLVNTHCNKVEHYFLCALGIWRQNSTSLVGQLSCLSWVFKLAMKLMVCFESMRLCWGQSIHSPEWIYSAKWNPLSSLILVRHAIRTVNLHILFCCPRVFSFLLTKYRIDFCTGTNLIGG